ncbi:MAG: hypothetical protein O2987_04200 [Firmicutes bacterium]|nr:hypothetical protein [Bacillota bacterium]
MNIPYKYLLLRLYAHIMLSLLGLYTVFIALFEDEGLIQAIVFFIAFLLSIAMYKTYQKASNQPKLMTPKEKTIFEYSLYVYIGLYISRTILMSTSYAFLNVYVGIILFLIASITGLMIYKIMK